jgi:hypothetical protein
LDSLSIRGYSDPKVPGEIPLASGPASVNVLILVTVEVVPHVAVAVAEAGITIAKQRLNNTSKLNKVFFFNIIIHPLHCYLISNKFNQVTVFIFLLEKSEKV